jgi:hypothetical protein
MESSELLHVKRPLQHWREILEEWRELVRRIHLETRGEFTPYSYKERTNVGFLGCAATRVGWTALEECASLKCVDEATCIGRADLQLWKGRRQNSVEAKLTTDSVSRLIRKIPRRHSSAVADAHRMPHGARIQRIAATFVIPRFPVNVADADAAAMIESVVDASKMVQPTFIASVFPGRSPRKTSDRNDIGKCAFGVVLIGTHV